MESPYSFKKQTLLEDADEEDEFKFPDENELNFKARKKLLKFQSSIGYDERFILNNRFIENEDCKEKEEEVEIDDLSIERKKQLEILRDVLGEPIFTVQKKQDEKNERLKSVGKMIRYDPTNKNHKEYEIVSQKPEKIKRQKRKEIKKGHETESVLVSNEVYYSVSDQLTNVLKEREEFSLLKTLGKDPVDSSTKQPEILYKSESKKNFGFNYEANKVFKYDSSDEEEPTVRNGFNPERVSCLNINENSERFLFTKDDPRYQEGEDFFKNWSEQNDDLKTLRPKLKQTIRKKILVNLKKNSTFSKKKYRHQKY